MSVQFTAASSQDVEFAHSTDFDDWTAMTVSAWVYADALSGSNRNVLTRWKYNDPSRARNWLLMYQSGGNQWWTAWAYDDTENNDAVTNNANVSTGEWIHLCSTWATTTRNLYVDGTAGTADTNSRTSITDLGAAPLIIAGQEDGVNYFDGWPPGRILNASI
jgi:hypothetical protein